MDAWNPGGNQWVLAYQTLGLPLTAGLPEIKLAYKKLARRYHPDKGGDPVHFQRIEWAYKNLIQGHQQWKNVAPSKGHHQLRQGSQEDIAITPIIPPDKFELGSFNKKFSQVKSQVRTQGGEHQVYDISARQCEKVQRNRADYQRNHAQIDQELRQNKPLFRGQYNANLFNRAFEYQQQNSGGAVGGGAGAGAVVQYQEPMPAASYGAGGAGGGGSMVQYSDVANRQDSTNLSSLNYGQYGADAGVQNPNNFDPNMMQQFRQNPDITQVTDPMDKRSIQDRIQAYRSFDPTQALKTGQHGMMGAVAGPPQPIPLPVSSSSRDGSGDVATNNGADLSTYANITPIGEQQMVSYGGGGEFDWQQQAEMQQMQQTQQMQQMTTQMEQMTQMNQMNQSYLQEQIKLLKNLNQVLNQYKVPVGSGVGGGNAAGNVGAVNVSQQQRVEPDTQAGQGGLESEVAKLRRLVKVQDQLLQQVGNIGDGAG